MRNDAAVRNSGYGKSGKPEWAANGRRLGVLALRRGREARRYALTGNGGDAGFVIGERGMAGGRRWLRQSGAGQCAQEARNERQRHGSGCEAAWAGQCCGGALHAPQP